MGFSNSWKSIAGGLLVGVVCGIVLLYFKAGGGWPVGSGHEREPVVQRQVVERPVVERPVVADTIAHDEASVALEDADTSLDIQRGNAITRATQKVAPAVVSINVVQAQQVKDPSMELWERMGLIPRREYYQHVKSMGSGVIVSEDGLVVTNSHVLEAAVQVVVTLSDGEQYQAKLVDIIDGFDLAVLQIKGENFPVARFADGAETQIGEWAIAIGSPYGYLLADTQPTVTVGVISALNRDIKRTSGERNYLGMTQTDAAINPGNSGGPLVNTQGEIIGINTFIFSEGGGSVGMGFAIPAARVQRVLEEIRQFGHYREISLGFSLQKLSPGMVQYLGLNDPHGFVIVQVVPGSPAWKAGLRPRDVLRSVEGFPLDSTDVLDRLLYEVQVGDRLDFQAERDQDPFPGQIIIEEAR